MATKHDFHKVIIGRSEILSFIDSSMNNVPAKTDTGAYRSAIHASDIKLNDDKSVSFVFLGGHPVCGSMASQITTKDYNVVWVANSFGHGEERYEVKLKVKLGPKVFHARFTLADRSKKIYPILLGRKLLNDRFLVDSSKTSLDRITLKQKYGISFPKDEEEGRES
jgi:hypothetical protein